MLYSEYMEVYTGNASTWVARASLGGSTVLIGSGSWRRSKKANLRVRANPDNIVPLTSIAGLPKPKPVEKVEEVGSFGD